jgi:hypothetical protein
MTVRTGCARPMCAGPWYEPVRIADLGVSCRAGRHAGILPERRAPRELGAPATATEDQARL